MFQVLHRITQSAKSLRAYMFHSKTVQILFVTCEIEALHRLTQCYCFNLAHMTEFGRIRLLTSVVSFQSPPAGPASPQSLPPEALYTRLAAICKRVPVYERSFCRPTVPALFAAEELKLLGKSVYTRAHTHPHTSMVSQSELQSPPSFASDLKHN